MKDEIFWGNLLGLLKKGKWDMDLEKSMALVAIYQEAEKRSKPQELKISDTEPIKESKAKK